MATVITIGGVDKTSLIDWASFARSEVLTKEANRLDFMIRKWNNQTYKPAIGAEIIVTVNSIREFAGIVTEINETVESRLEYIKVSCKDYTHVLDRYQVASTYQNMSVNAIISAIMANYTDGTFTTVNVNCPTVIDNISFNYLSVSKSLEKIADLVTGFEWYVDYNKDIHFFLVSSQTPAFNLTDTAGNYFFNSLEIRQDNSQLRNDVVVRGGIAVSTTTRQELLSGDGGKYIFPLATKFHTKPTVTVGGVGKTVGIENVDGGGFDVYWNYTEKSLKFIVTPANATNNIVVEGNYEYPLIVNKTDETSIMQYGVYQYVIVDKTIQDIDTASMRASADLASYSQPTFSADFDTNTYGLKTGQYINIQSDIRGINKNFKIQTVKANFRNPAGDFKFRIEAITTDEVGINDVLSQLLITNQSDQLDVASDEFISRIRQVSDSLAITDSVPTYSKQSGPYRYENYLLNQIYNPSFESNVTDNIALENNLTGGTPVLSRDTSTFQFGTACAKIVITSPANSEIWRVKLRNNEANNLKIFKNKQYSVSAYVKTSDSRNIQIALENAGAVSGYYSSATATNSSTFTRISFTFTATADDLMTLNILCNNGSTGTIYIDGLMVELGSSSTTYFDGSTTDVSPLDYTWVGTPNNSASCKATYTPGSARSLWGLATWS